MTIDQQLEEIQKNTEKLKDKILQLVNRIDDLEYSQSEIAEITQDSVIRNRALELAVQLKPDFSQGQIVCVAQTFYDFLKGQTPNQDNQATKA